MQSVHLLRLSPLLAALLCARATGAQEYLDLTYPFDEQTIYWPTSRPFQLDKVWKGTTEAGFYYEANNYSAAEHGGTHLDAPSHFAPGRWSVDEVPLSSLIGPAVVVDISARAAGNPDAVLDPADLLAWQKKHGPLPQGAILLVRTGWGRFWPDRKRYLGTDRPGDVAGLRFPGISAEAAQWIASSGRVRAVGIDTASLDPGRSKDFRAHVILYEKNIPGLENVAHLDRLPPVGATLIALPMKIRGGSGAPCRIIARLPGK
ncbi:MAG: cyclase family protein [Myxococcota bacterium]|nr:cyclase family protein [Myxococcota bacterium]